MKSGYKDKYDAKPTGSRNDSERPLAALDMARSVNVFVMTDVVRAKHAAMVKGLNKKLLNPAY
jgi:hypothetical protein